MKRRSHRFPPLYSPQKQRGLGLATALFVITAMSLLAALIVQLVRSNSQTIQEEVLLVRSFYAAESGVQYGLNRAFPPDGSATQCPLVADTTTFVPAAITQDGLNQCTASVMCTTLPVSGTGTIYTIESTGTCGDVSRTIQVRAE